jgi:hypothetical protein
MPRFKKPTLATVIVCFLMLIAAIIGFRAGIKENQKPGSVSDPIILSGPCPATIICPEDGRTMKLDHCFQHTHLQRQVCEFQHEGPYTFTSSGHYLYVACDLNINGSRHSTSAKILANRNSGREVLP